MKIYSILTVFIFAASFLNASLQKKRWKPNLFRVDEKNFVDKKQLARFFFKHRRTNVPKKETITAVERLEHGSLKTRRIFTLDEQKTIDPLECFEFKNDSK